jgi:hypothetical protein
MYFTKCATLEELKKQYRELCRAHHPDLGGNEETMKLINIEYERLVRSGAYAEEMSRTGSDEDIEAAFREVLEKLTVLSGLVLEICGSWLWVTGNTYQHKESLKSNGFKFASKKLAWFWRPDEAKSRNRKPLSLEEIRERHGSKVIHSNGMKNALA